MEQDGLFVVAAASAHYYPLRLPVRIDLLRQGALAEQFIGTTSAISSGIVRCRVQQNLRSGMRVLVRIDWPVLLNGQVGIVLVVQGRVVFRESDSIEVVINKYEFRVLASKQQTSTQSLAAR